ncbi:MAG: pilus assembly protein PilM [Cellulomonas sp.]|uniref:Pilus assembly protein PilM n=1 Tax=Cellulomonas gelida TaxID=1712 RepID=A0A4Y3KFZ5_9CELL|nr:MULTISPECIES: type IV pilus assembly protein PilM [Cellulomonas]KMM47145.1 pilus assembly protein PilM [Cellulomonas sp. A375-1]MCR6647358.1 pilus assembly protein PilM [Cellulomonas sp.]MCR6703341.1 pilus assembly protein PilM [Cellulomonas sp.]GEA82892.1 pilus assembly protein PilM [Cellulomonas gelida]GGL34869.1 pilus assembly protein PilM [Cellulomonas gelida]
MANTRVIGLDIGTSAVRAAELEFGAGGPKGKTPPTLVRYGEVPVPLGAVRDGEVIQPESVATALRQLWSQAKFESKEVILGVGNQRVLVRELEVPWMPVAQIKESLPYQVGEMLPMAVDDALLDFYPTGETDSPQGRQARGMLVAAQRDTVTANVLAAEAAGLQPQMVDLNAFALLRALARGDLANATAAFVDIGATITTVVVAARGVPRLVRSLPSGGQHVTNALATARSISAPEAEALKREIGIGYAVSPDRQDAAEAVTHVVRGLVESVRNTFVYYAGNNPGGAIDVVVLSGGGSHLPGLGQYLSSASRLPVTLADPLAGLRMAKTARRDQITGRESCVALPVGLAYGVAA